MSGEGKISAWIVAIGTLLGGLGGAVAVVAFVRDYDNPIARAILDDKHRLSANGRIAKEEFLQERIRDDAAWQDSLNEDTPEAYASYISAYSNGRHVTEAFDRRALRIEDRVWQAAVQSNTEEGYHLYLASYPNGQHSQIASDRVDKLQKSRSRPAYTIDAVDEIARVNVRAARENAIRAQEAQRKARRNESGYASAVLRPYSVSDICGGKFEGASQTEKHFLGDKKAPVLGVWIFEIQNVPDGKGGSSTITPTISQMEAQVTSSEFSYLGGTTEKLSGQIEYPNGNKYEGEFSCEGSTDPYSPFIRPDGLGVLWSAKGDLIGSGRWVGGSLSAK